MRRRVLAALAGCLLATACGSGPSATDGTPGAAQSARLLATQPYLRVISARDAYLIWPSGPAWLLLHTSNGFRTITNRTPIAVDTGGGLVADFAGSGAAVAVGPTERLYRSPFVTARGRQQWAPAELPGGVVNDQGAVSLRATGRTALPVAVIAQAHGTVIQRTSTGWETLTSGSRLDPAGTLRLDAVSWLSPRVAVVVGAITGRSGAVAFRTTDGGTTWRPLTGMPTDAVAALAPCRSKQTTILPVVLRSGAEMMLRSADAGASWSSGGRFTAASIPAWGCSAVAVWAVARGSDSTSLLVSTDAGRTWRTAGAPPAGLVALAPIGAGDGFAATGGSSPTLYAVSDSGQRFRRVRLPAWVATIGQQMGTT